MDYGFLNGNFKKEAKVILRKIVVENKDKDKAPLYFEVGKPVSKYNDEMGVISAITFNEQKSLKFVDVIHNVHIQKPNGEEFLWKEIWRDRIVEFDVD
jgi:hypothetical protein